MRVLATALLVVACSVLLASPASAHPTDETVQQVYLTPAVAGSTVELELTPGVLVAPQFARTLDTDGDGTLGTAEIDAHVAAVGAAVSARVDGGPVALTPAEHRYPPLDLLAAGGGTITLTWTVAVPADARQVTVTDTYEPGGRTTVQQSVLVAPGPIPLGPITHSDGGRTMAVALNGAPGPVAAPADPAASSPMLDALRRPLTSPWALPALVGACVLLGALHALTPGHGKALLAGYLVGSRGTPRHAVALGVATTAGHTAAVVALGAVLLLAGPSLVPGAVVPVLTLVAGVVVLGLGVRLVRLRWGAAARVPVPHGHGHGQLVARPSLRSVAVMGVTAGMIPCPEALSVLLLAVGLQRTALGLLMIVAFSAGLAAVLVGLGLVLVTAGSVKDRVTNRVPGWVTTRLPLVSAAVVAVLGAVMTVTAVATLAG